MAETPPIRLDPTSKRHCLGAKVCGDLVTVRWRDPEFIGEHSVVLQCACDPTLVARTFKSASAVRLTHDALSCSVCAQWSQATEARWYFCNPLLLNFIVSRPGDRGLVTTTETTHPGMECVYEG